MSPLTVCWIGNHRYRQPLNPTDDKKWQLLSQLGVPMLVVAFASGIRPRRFTQHARFILLPELPLAPLRYAEMFLLGPLLLLGLILTRRVNVIVAQSPFEGAIGAAAKQIARLFGRRVALVVESHGDFEVAVLEQRQVTSAGLYRRVMAACARYGLRQADVLRAVSDSTRQQLQRWGATDQPLVQFMTWTDAGAFRGRVREVALAQAQDILYAGVLIPRKGVHTLIDAFAQLAQEQPAAHLWLVGKPENAGYTAQLHEQVSRAGLDERVTFVGGVDQPTLAGYMTRSRCLVLASTSEGLPRVVVEAMMSGLVPIATRVSGIPEVIRDGETGYLIPPEDPAALLTALRTVYQHADIDAMGARARAYAEQFFTEAAYLDGYRQLLSHAADSLT